MPSRQLRGLLVGVLVLAGFVPSMIAVGRNRVLYIGGNVEQFPGRIANLEGTLEFASADFTFQAGRTGSLTIPYDAVSLVEYGIRASSKSPRLVQVIPWDPYEQFTKKVHYLLTILLKSADGPPRAIVFELGAGVERPILEALEQRTGQPVVFPEAELCIRFRTAEACDYGTPSELKGLRRVYLGEMRSNDRELLRDEISKAGLGVEFVTDATGSELVLNLRTDFSMDPRCPCEGGRGEILAVHGDRRRTLFVFTGSKRGVWGTRPAIGFGRAFVDEFKKAHAQ